MATMATMVTGRRVVCFFLQFLKLLTLQLRRSLFSLTGRLCATMALKLQRWPLRLLTVVRDEADDDGNGREDDGDDGEDDG